MKSFIEFILSVLAILCAALVAWWSWNEVSNLFTFLPPQWEHLSFMQCFWLAWLLRLITGIVRAPEVKAPDLKKK